MKNFLALIVVAAGTAASQGAVTVDWANWTGGGAPGAASVATGNINAIGLTYTGEIDFAQLNNSGTDYWRNGAAVPFPAYTTGNVANVPATVDLVSVSGNGQSINTITFSQPVTNPYMAIVSLGQYGIGTTYHFDAPFVIDSNDAGYWGNGTLVNAGANVFGGETLVGHEGHGIIQFIGTFTSISFATEAGEHWNGFTFGLATPTPGATAALCLGALGASRRRRP